MLQSNKNYRDQCKKHLKQTLLAGQFLLTKLRIMHPQTGLTIVIWRSLISENKLLENQMYSPKKICQSVSDFHTMPVKLRIHIAKLLSTLESLYLGIHRVRKKIPQKVLSILHLQNIWIQIQFKVDKQRPNLLLHLRSKEIETI